MQASKRRSPNTVFVVLGAVAIVILAALMSAWSHIGYPRLSASSLRDSSKVDPQVSSQPPSGRCCVPEKQQPGVELPPAGSVEDEKSDESPMSQAPSSKSGFTDGINARVYIVQPGDTLSGISAATGVSVNRLAQANGIENIDLIYADSALVIP